MLTRDQMLRPMARTYKDTKLSDGTMLRHRDLNELELSQFRTAALTKDEQGNLVSDLAKVRTQPRRLIVMCAVDADGNPLLAESDIPALGKADGRLVQEMYEACRRHCGLEEAEKAAGDAEKNSEPTGD